MRRKITMMIMVSMMTQQLRYMMMIIVRLAMRMIMVRMIIDEEGDAVEVSINNLIKNDLRIFVTIIAQISNFHGFAAHGFLPGPANLRWRQLVRESEKTIHIRTIFVFIHGSGIYRRGTQRKTPQAALFPQATLSHLSLALPPSCRCLRSRGPSSRDPTFFCATKPSKGAHAL
jgi:hypothetical protein